VLKIAMFHDWSELPGSQPLETVSEKYLSIDVSTILLNDEKSLE